MKKLLFILLLILTPSYVQAAYTIPWNGTTTSGTVLNMPVPVGGIRPIPYVPFYIATSTTASSFPYASTTSITSSGSVYFVTDGVSKAGIGTTTPATTLDVQGIFPQLTLGVAAGSNAGGIQFRRGSSGGAITGSFGFNSATDSGLMTWSSQGGAGAAMIATVAAIRLKPANGAGNIIGSASNGNWGIGLDNGATIGSSTPWGIISINPTQSNGASPSFVIGSSSATSFIVDYGGNTGISTTTPFTTLSVGGSVFANGSITGSYLKATSTAVTISDTTVVNTTASSSAFTVGTWANRTYTANSLRTNDQICMEGYGSYGTQTGLPSATVRMILGTGGASTTLTQVTTSALPSGSSGLGFYFKGCATVRSTGASGTVQSNGTIDYETAIGTNKDERLYGSSKTVDFTVAQTCDVSIQWSAADPSNTVTINQATCQIK